MAKYKFTIAEHKWNKGLYSVYIQRGDVRTYYRGAVTLDKATEACHKHYGDLFKEADEVKTFPFGLEGEFSKKIEYDPKA